MQSYTLEITGNHESKTGNPIPFTRVLSNKLRADGARYLAWQAWVRAVFTDKYPNMRYLSGRSLGPPIRTQSKHVFVTCDVMYRDKTHGDLDNIVKGLLDALLEQDKYVMCISSKASYGKIGAIKIQIDVSN